jgi:DNA polymerase III subunit gamma/tau
LVRDGAEPGQVLNDLAEAVHITTRHKAVGADAVGDGLSAEQKRRAAAVADAVSVPFLARAWQILLKGIAEADRAPSPQTAAEMVLIRLAYTADLPTPDAVIKALGSSGASQAGAQGTPSSQPAGNSQPAPAMSQGSPSASEMTTSSGPPPGPVPQREMKNTQHQLAPSSPEKSETSKPAGNLATFEDLIKFVGEKRDAKLRVHLEDHVSVVKYDGQAQAIDLFLLPGAPSELAYELREKLNAWTNSRWMIVLSRERGARAVGDVRREREAADRAAVAQHPAIKAVLDVFPDAEISEIRRLPGDDAQQSSDDDSQTG